MSDKAALLLGAGLFACGTSIAAAAPGGDDLLAMPLEHLMQTEVQPASRAAKQLSEAHTAVSIVTADDIRTFGHRTLGDILNSMRGLSITRDYRYQFLGGRGFGSPGDFGGRVLLLIDGYPAQDNLSGQLYLDESGLLDVDLIDRVEYIPGSGSAHYGPGAFYGVINVTTKNGRDFNALRLSGEAASHDTFRKRATWGRQLDNGADLLVSVSEYRSAGQDWFFPYFETVTGNGQADGLDGQKAHRAFVKFQYEGLTLEAGQSASRKASPVPLRITDNLGQGLLAEGGFGRRTTTDDRNTYVNAHYDWGWGETLRASSRLYAGQYNDGLATGYDYNGLAMLGNAGIRNDGVGRWQGLDQQFVYTGLRGHTISFGVDYRNDDMAFNVLGVDAAGARTGVDIKYRLQGSNLGLRLTDAVRLGDTLTAHIGARYDRPRLEATGTTPLGSGSADYRLGEHWTPHLALIWQAGPRTTFKASHHAAVRIPTPLELPVDFRPLRPEHVTSDELVWVQEFGDAWRFTGSLFRYHLSNIQYLQPNGELQPTGIDNRRDDGQIKPYGAEAQIDKRWGEVSLRASVAWRRTDQPERVIANDPVWLGKFNLGLPLGVSGLRAGLEALYMDSRYTKFPRFGVSEGGNLRGDSGAIVGLNRQLTPYTLVNFTVSTTRTWHGLSVSASVRNLFDRQYESVAGQVFSTFDPMQPNAPLSAFDSLPMPGRTFWLQLNYDLGM